MKSKAVIPLVLGLGIGLMAIKLTVDAVQNAQGTPTELITTVIARTDIPASFAITPEMLNTVQTPATPLLPEGAFIDAEALVGRVTSKNITQGTAISPGNLAPPGTSPGLTERIPEGHRAVSVRIDEVSGIAGQITPGDYVDVIVVMKVRRNRQDETISRIILQRIKVLAIGQNMGSAHEAGAQKMARSITLLITNNDVPKLHLAQTQGKITLAMRGADDRLIGDEGYATTAQWNPNAAPVESDADQPSTLNGLGDDQQTQLANGKSSAKAEGPRFAVTVVNGPISSDGVASLQRITYESRTSTKVLDVSRGRSSSGNASGSDSAESIMRRPHLGNALGYPSRSTPWPEDIDQVQDREISAE